MWSGKSRPLSLFKQKLKRMITITKGHDWAKSVSDLKEELLKMIETELECYDPEDTGWSKYSRDELDVIVDRYLDEVTDKEIDDFKEWCEYGDRDEAIMCYLNEWAFHPDGAGY